MRRMIVVVALAVAGALLVLSGSPAVAGGPTSMMLVNHEGSRAAALLNGSPDYAALEEFVQQSTPSQMQSPTDANTRWAVRGVWYLHEVTPWRTNAFVMATDGKLWICTAESYGGSVAGEECSWGVAPQPKQLIALLTRQGLLGPVASAEATTVPSPSAPAGTPLRASPEPTVAAALTGPAGNPPGLLIAAGAVGVLVGVLGVTIARRLRSRG